MERGTRTNTKKEGLDLLFLLVTFGGFFLLTGVSMGVSQMFSTLMETAYRLLIDTVFYIMAIAVLAGAFGKVADEFGLIQKLNLIFSPLMRPLYNLPGSAFLGIITTFLSDNPAIISLTRNKEFLRYFKRHEIPCLCNLGTSFGMGLIVTTFMASLGYGKAAGIGLLGAVVGSVVSVRLMLRHTKKLVSDDSRPMKETDSMAESKLAPNSGSRTERMMRACLEGGKYGVEIGLEIVPGVLIICTVIMMLTFGPSESGYTGAAFEGIALIPRVGELFAPVTRLLFGFTSSESIAVPLTALGSVGASLSLVPKFLNEQIIGANEIAVFTAMGMCWSGFLSTHVAMLDALNFRQLISKAISSHLIGGIAAGVSAHYLYLLLG
jgi:ABC-type cobalt transport system substrate-binding protein